MKDRLEIASRILAQVYPAAAAPLPACKVDDNMVLTIRHILAVTDKLISEETRTCPRANAGETVDIYNPVPEEAAWLPPDICIPRRLPKRKGANSSLEEEDDD